MERLTPAQAQAELRRRQANLVYEQQASRIRALVRAGNATERDMVWLLANDSGLEVRAQETRAKKQRRLAQKANASMPESFFHPYCLWRV